MKKFIDKVLQGVSWRKLSVRNNKETFLDSELPGGFERWRNSEGKVVYYKLPGGFEEEFDFQGNKIYIHHPGEYKEWREFNENGRIHRILEYTSEGKYILDGEEIDF